MAEHERAARGKHGEVDQKHRHRQKQQGPEPSSEKSLAWDTGPFSLTETPFYPRMGEHAAMLSRIPSAKQRHDFIIQLHKTYGNRYVQRLMESVSVQAKLNVSATNDVFEQEADRVADAVTRAVNPPAQRQTPEEEELQMKASQVQRQEEEEELQTELTESRPAGVSENLERRIDAARSEGELMTESVRASLEPQFGIDFGAVRIHTDAEANMLSQQLGAKAFTTGNSIFFKHGEYSPESEPGLKLLAHELTHTTQQGASTRISPWWPKGHRHITRNAFSAEGLLPLYDKVTREYLAERSADMDFMQDEVNAMEKGRAASAPLIKDFKAKMQHLRGLYGEKTDMSDWDPEDRATLDNLKETWDRNRLHVRDSWYMMHHGEGGLYRETKETGASKNKALTKQLLTLAIGLYKEKPNVALSVLSDALHQAEDRGSHQEGAKFSGHDIRKTEIHGRLVPDNAEDKPPPGYFDPGWDPDNAEKNTEGAAYALKFAADVLKEFKNGVKASEKVPVSQEEKARKPRIRHASFKGLPPVESTAAVVKAKGKTREEKIDALVPSDWNELQDEVRELSAEEQSEVAGGMTVYVCLWVESELIERLRSAEGGPKWTSKQRLEFAETHYDRILAALPLFAGHVGGQKDRICARAVANWEYHIGQRQQPGRKKEEKK